MKMFKAQGDAKPRDITLHTDNGEVKLPEAALNRFPRGCRLTTVIASIFSGDATSDEDSDIVYNDEDATFYVDADSNDLQLVVRYIRAKISNDDIGKHLKALGEEKLRSLRASADRWQFDALEIDLNKHKVPPLSQLVVSAQKPTASANSNRVRDGSAVRNTIVTSASPQRNRVDSSDSNKSGATKQTPNSNSNIPVPNEQLKRSSFFGAKPGGHSQQSASTNSTPRSQDAVMPNKNNSVGKQQSMPRPSVTAASSVGNKFSDGDHRPELFKRNGNVSPAKSSRNGADSPTASKRVSFTGGAASGMRAVNDKAQHRPGQSGPSSSNRPPASSNRFHAVHDDDDDAQPNEDDAEVDAEAALAETYARAAEKKNAVLKPTFRQPSAATHAPRAGIVTPAMAQIEKQRNLQQGQQRAPSAVQQLTKPGAVSHGRPQVNVHKQDFVPISKPSLQSSNAKKPVISFKNGGSGRNQVNEKEAAVEENDAEEHEHENAALVASRTIKTIPSSKAAPTTNRFNPTSSNRSRDLIKPTSPIVIDDEDDDEEDALAIKRKPMKSATNPASTSSTSRRSVPQPSEATKKNTVATKQARKNSSPEVIDDDENTDLPDTIEIVDSQNKRGAAQPVKTPSVAAGRRNPTRQQQQSSNKRRLDFAGEEADNDRSDDAVDIEELPAPGYTDDEEKSDSAAAKRKVNSFVKSLSKSNDEVPAALPKNKKTKPEPMPSRSTAREKPVNQKPVRSINQKAAKNVRSAEVDGDADDGIEMIEIKTKSDEKELSVEQPIEAPIEEELRDLVICLLSAGYSVLTVRNFLFCFTRGTQGPLILVAPNGDELVVDHVEKRSYDYYFPFPEADATQPQYVPSALKLPQPQPKMALTFRCAVDIDQEESLTELAQKLAASGRTVDDRPIEPTMLRDFIIEKVALLRTEHPSKICFIKPPLLGSVIDAANKQKKMETLSEAAPVSSPNKDAEPPTATGADANTSFCATVVDAEKAVITAVAGSKFDEPFILSGGDAAPGLGMIDQLALHGVCGNSGIYF